MTRDALPRAYLRVDPNIDQVYPELRSTFVGLLCAAHRQPERGRFRDRRLVEQLCGRAYVGRAFDRGDVVTLGDGRVYLVGWDEWQEGDMTVAERMRRMRERRKRDASSVTRASHGRSGVTTDAVAKELSSPVIGDSDSDSPPPPAKRGRRKNGTAPRQRGTAPRQKAENPRANGTSPRQERQAQKQGGMESLHAILARANEAGR